LLLSLALLSVAPVWIHRQDEIALGRYLGLRLTLVAALDALDEDPLWLEWKLTHETETVPIEQLASIRVNSTTLAPLDNATQGAVPLTKPRSPTRPPDALSPSKPPPIKRRNPAPRTNPGAPAALPEHSGLGAVGAFGRVQQVAYHLIQNGPTCKPTDPRCPAAPTGLGFVEGLEEIRQAVDCLAQLNDPDLLTRSRNASDFFNLSVYRWVLRRDNLIAQSRFGSASSRVARLHTEPDPRLPANFTPAADKTALLGLTLGAVRELAKAELPPISNTVKLGPSDPEVELTTSSLPRSLYGASLFGQVLLFFVIVYFDAFTRKATSATHFPSPETLFGALSGGRLTLIVFLLALWTPLAASVGILVVSYGATSMRETVGLALCTALIGAAVASAHSSLSHRSYFHSLLRRNEPDRSTG